MIYQFDDFELDTRLFELRRNGAGHPLEPQVYEVLAFLVQHHDRVVTKDELLDHVWPERYITEAALNSRLMAARKALGDSGKEQRYIKTIHGRGYRFVGQVTERAGDSVAKAALATAASLVSGDAARPLPPMPLASGSLVGRENEQEFLTDAFGRAAEGKRQVVFITGEPGIGKTTLVDAFLDRVVLSGGSRIARGQCIDYRGAPEAYMPVLDAFGLLARGESAASVISLMLERAPSWLNQLPWLVAPEEAASLRDRTAGANRDRMLREMLELLDVLSASQPLVLVLEDVHWADHSTVDLLEAIARRQHPARLMIISTVRPADASSRNHPLPAIQRELCARGYALELPLARLSPDHVERYLLERFPGCECPEELADVLHQRTEGNPLFVESVLDSWIASDAIRQADNAWVIRSAPSELASKLPDNLRDVIGLQVAQVEAHDQELLQVASVAGSEFASTAVAAAFDARDEDEIESQLSQLARRGLFLIDRGVAEFADGTVCARFAFAHELYREVLYGQIPPGRLARLHRAMGSRLATAYASTAVAHAAELAMHFLAARDAPRAVEYVSAAANQALSRGAPREALDHINIALGLLKNADVPERDARELSLRMLLPPAILATRGFAAPELEQAYSEALELAARMGDEKARASLTYSLAAVHEYRGQHQKAYEALSGVSPDHTPGDRLAVEYHALLSCTHFHRGGFALTIDHADHGLSLDQHASSDPRYAALGEDPGVGCNEWSSLALWFVGLPDQALERAREGVRLASAPERAYSLASAQTHLARVHQLRREHGEALDVAERTVELAIEFGFVYHTAVSTIVEGWAKTMLGKPGGIERLAQGIDLHKAIGADMDRSYFLALHGEALRHLGRHDEARKVLEEAIQALPDGATYYYEAEVHRLLGEAMLRIDQSDEALDHFDRALEVARDQGARAIELRIVVSLGRYLIDRGRSADAGSLVRPLFDAYSEGLDTQDLVDARVLLDSIASA